MIILIRYGAYCFVFMYGIELGQYDLKERFNGVYADFGAGDMFGILDMLINKGGKGLPELASLKTEHMCFVEDPIGYSVMRTFEGNLTLERARKLLRDIVSYVEASGSDSTEDAGHLLKIGFSEDELRDLGYGEEAIKDALRNWR